MINVVLSLQSKLDEANKHVLVERQCQANGQYSRRGCLDVQAFPVKQMRMFWKRKSSTFLDSLVVILRKLKPTVESAKKVTVKFRKRKDCQQVWSVKKDMQKIKMEDVNFPGQNKFFINRNFGPYYKVLWSKSKKLHSLGKIFSFYISSDTIKIKSSENNSQLTTTQVDDFGKCFPNIE